MEIQFSRDEPVCYRGNKGLRELEFTYVWERLDGEVTSYIIEHPDGLLPSEIIEKYSEGKIKDGFLSVYETQLKNDLRFIKVQRDEIKTLIEKK